MSASIDGSESVDQFLARVASLSNKTGAEDAERSRKMEEEMLLARKERQARRAERARSLSPSKTGPASSLPSLPDTKATFNSSIDPPIALSSNSQISSATKPEGLAAPSSKQINYTPMTSGSTRPLPPRPDEQQVTVGVPMNSATSLSRSGTLSWQQRPLSRDIPSVRSRPLSRSPVSMRDTTAVPSNDLNDKEDMSRKEITDSLSAKDPSWFRQTQERGVASPALRKSDSENDRPPPRTTQGMRLPGMSDTAPISREPQSSNWDIRSMSEEPPMKMPDVQVQRSNTTAEFNRHSVADGMIRGRTNEPLSLKPRDQIGSADGEVLLPNRSSSFLTSSRSPSPTKGLGGFVQSAWMKRSDSVNKRWSVQASSGLKRGDSVAGSRPTSVIGGMQTFAGTNRSPTRDSQGLREGTSSPLGGSRPSSSHAADKALTPTEVESNIVKPNSKGASPILPLEAVDKAKSNQETIIEEHSDSTSDNLLPRSPSKTMDPRRWSPTKSSWLESALLKPESPRASTIRTETPAWKVGLQRSKAEKESQRVAEDKDLTLDHKKPAAPPQIQPSTDAVLKYARPSSAVIPKGEETKFPDPIERLEKSEKESFTDPKSISDDRIETIKEPPVKPNTIPTPEPTFISKANVEKTPDKKPPVLKSKPQTPPKTDFRAGLKPRHAASASTDEREPEFLSMFGKLKRTQTHNYVPPDELKENITQGKAALNVTGGPKKTRRVDEFKESILQQKENMKGGSMHRRAESTAQRDPSSDIAKPPVPEALARRKTLHRASSSRDTTTDPKTSTDTSLLRTKSEQVDNSQENKDKQSLGNFDVKADRKAQQQNVVEDPIKHSMPESRLAMDGPLRSQSSPQGTNAQSTVKDFKEPESKPSATAASQVSVTELPANKRLAARLNPALAEMLSRGGNTKSSGDSEHPTPSISTPSAPLQTARPRGHEDSRNGPLTHATKGRAKGPKRRTPKADSVIAQEDEISSSKAANRSEVKTDTKKFSARLAEKEAPEVTRQSPVEENRSEIQRGSSPKSMDRNDGFQNKNFPNGVKTLDDKLNTRTPLSFADKQDKMRPIVAAKSPELRKVSGQQQNPVNDNDESFTKATPIKKVDPTTETPNKPSIATPFSARLTPNPSAKKPGLFFSAGKVKETATPPIRVQEEAIEKIDYTPTKGKMNGLGLDLSSREKKVFKASELTPPPEKDIKVSSIATKSSDQAVKKDEDSDARLAIEGFFGTVPQARDRADFDTQSFLAGQKTTSAKTKSVNNRMWEVNGDGKMVSMPPNQEHILFEDSMYLCVHTFETGDKSKTSEVYLWCGEAVAESAIEDAQLFCRKAARENNAKLQVLKQGKEPSHFFQALGGIVIVRKSKSSALYMLCGRRYLGHVSFDEVDFSVSSLCTGFPYIISAKFGKLYLWKGRGSGADEIGCARLIGMDLGLTGEIEEVSEGEETPSFWEAFPTPLSKPTSWSEIWSVRDQHNGYPSKLFRVEHDRPKSSGGFWGLRSPSSPPKSSNKALVEEISPFCQTDLEPHNLYILDAYAKIYLFVGSAASSKAGEFATALQIAQEIAVLTPSLQDRSLLPKCQVIFGDPPQDFKAAFRKWTPPRPSNVPQKSVCIPAEAVFKVLGL